jgi:serine/threonine-protein kinase RsbW
MSKDPGGTSPHETPGAGRFPGNLVEARLRTSAEVVPLLDRVVGLLEGLGYSAKEVFGVRLALEEAAVNGLKHGNADDPSRSVWVRYRADAAEVWLEVEDEGPGFDPGEVPDPLAPENLENPSGRGLFLMRTYMSSVEYNARGNRVRMRKVRGPS